MTDALATGEQTVGELLRREVRITRDVLEPFHAVARGALQLEHLHVALLAVGAERPIEVGAARDAARDVAAQRYGVFHGELGAGADGEMGRMGGIADEHHLAVMPALAAHAVEAQPGRSAQMTGIALQRVAVEITAEQPFAEGDRLFGVEPVQPMRLPGLLPRLHDHRGEILAELVGVDLEPAVFRPLEGEREGVERLGGAQPDEATMTGVDVRLEYPGMAVAGLAVDAIRGNDEVRVGEAPLIVHLMLEPQMHSQCAGAVLQEVQQTFAADAGEAVAAADESPAVEMDLDVVPVMETREYVRVRDRVRVAEVLHGLIGEHHAPAEGVVGPIALVHLDARRRQGLAQQDGGIQSRGPAA